MISQLLKPKSKEEVLRELSLSHPGSFHGARESFKRMFNEDIPEEYEPFIHKLMAAFSKDDGAQQETYHSQDMWFTVKNTSFHVHPHTWKEVIVTVSPVRKIKDMEHLRKGNAFTVDNIEDFVKIILFYENAA